MTAGTGTASLSADTLSIGVTGAPRTAPILLMHGDAMQNGGAGVPFADGLLCVGGSTAGLAGAISAGGASVSSTARAACVSSAARTRSMQKESPNAAKASMPST